NSRPFLLTRRYGASRLAASATTTVRGSDCGEPSKTVMRTFVPAVRERLNKRMEAWIWAWRVCHWQENGLFGPCLFPHCHVCGCRHDCGHITPAERAIDGGAP